MQSHLLLTGQSTQCLCTECWTLPEHLALSADLFLCIQCSVRALCVVWLPGGKPPKAMKIWYADQGGMPADINYAAVALGVGAGVLLMIILWLANCFAKSYCGEPSCPSPLFKPKPSATTAGV